MMTFTACIKVRFWVSSRRAHPKTFLELTQNLSFIQLVCLIGYHYSTERHGTEWHIPWHYSPERNRADTRVPQPINYSIGYLMAMGVLERLDL